MSFDASSRSRIPAGSGADRAPDDLVCSSDAASTIPPIPAEVWDQVDAASRLAESLHAEGRAVHFDVHHAGGVVASLVDDSGPLRALPLEDVVDPHRLARELGADAE